MTELNLTWLLLLPALGFAVGWLASRLDLRQVRAEERHSPRAYYKGLNLLLNEQQDKAIDAFIEAVQNDPDTTELHFALGNLFRRRGEFERSVRVHQHLLSRADLSAADRDRAQYALAQDYAKAGLFDRAEAAYRALEGSAFSTEARRALLDLYERSRDWKQAHEMASKLEASGTGSYAARMAHHLCEQAQERWLEAQAGAATATPACADEGSPQQQAWTLLQQAHTAAPMAARPVVMQGQWLARQGQPAQALATWAGLLRLPQAPVALVADEIVQLVQTANGPEQGRGHASDTLLIEQSLHLLRQAYAAQESLVVLQAINALAPGQAGPALQAHLERQPSLSAAAAVLKLPPEQWLAQGLSPVQKALERSAKPLQRYRCAACGFEAQRYFWQCPGCLSWDSYPPQRIEDQ
ncbi:MAG: lipopolysaccharide assembly protein LapB [Betaproteobacteria bacterium]|nr:lipopolysaccharide assembly protein LapB [Betaproteobacteria bacterium]NBT10294.1 lipopolysaccharide assembly protein LapB [Betaproteobacteria bacterium]